MWAPGVESMSSGSVTYSAFNPLSHPSSILLALELLFNESGDSIWDNEVWGLCKETEGFRVVQSKMVEMACCVLGVFC